MQLLQIKNYSLTFSMGLICVPAEIFVPILDIL